MTDTSNIKSAVKERYGKIAQGSAGCCGADKRNTMSEAIGYTREELGDAPQDADLGLGCGNPVALASLNPGEVVLDLGSGAGLDCFLAAKRVGESGKVIGVDMTPEMLEKATANARSQGLSNVEFRRGEIENLPVDSDSVDVVISNCVINLSEDKARVFSEIQRVLKPGGRFYISDIVLSTALPASISDSMDAYCGCVAGAVLKDDYLGMIRKAGLHDIKVTREARYPGSLADVARTLAGGNASIPEEDLRRADEAVVSVDVQGTKTAASRAACC